MSPPRSTFPRGPVIVPVPNEERGGESALDITQELSKYRVDSSWFPALWSHTAYRTLL